MTGKILIAEDDIFLSNIYKSQLQEKGLEVTIFPNGVDVHEFAQEHQPDLILLDLIMPIENGFNVLEELKKDPKTKNIPVLILSKLSQPEDFAKAQKLGAQEYISKTETTFAKVILTIEKYLNNKV